LPSAGGQHIAALVIGDDHLGHLGAEISGLGDHPYARFRAGRSGHDTADIISVDRDRVLGAKLAGARAKNPAIPASATPSNNARLAFIL